MLKPSQSFQEQGPCRLHDTFGRATRGRSTASALAVGFLLRSKTPTEKLMRKPVPSAQVRLTRASLSGEARAGSGCACQLDHSLPVQQEWGESLRVLFLLSHCPCSVPAPAASGPGMQKGHASRWKGAVRGAWRCLQEGSPWPGWRCPPALLSCVSGVLLSRN